jgi:hypothetical protein
VGDLGAMVIDEAIKVRRFPHNDIVAQRIAL